MTVSDLTKLKSVCTDPEANPLAVVSALNTATSREWQDWEPGMIRDFVGLKSDQDQQMDKIMACQVGVTNPDVFDDWTLFHNVTTAFNHHHVNFDWLEPHAPSELAWSCVCLRGMNGTTQFGMGVLRYIGATIITEGMVYFPWSGGDGLHLCHKPHGEWARGLVDHELCAIGDELKKRWDNGDLQELGLSEVDDTDPFQVQLYKLVACQQYIRDQRPRRPEDYS